MQLLRENLTADGSTTGITWTNPNNGVVPTGTLYIFGSSFGGGTVTGEVSPDGGTTWIPLKDDTGTAISTTTNAHFNFSLASGSNNPIAGEQIRVRATLAGATSPSLTIVIAGVR